MAAKPLPKIFWWIGYAVYSLGVFALLDYTAVDNHLDVAIAMLLAVFFYLVHFFGAALFFSKILRKDFGLGIRYALLGYAVGALACGLPVLLSIDYFDKHPSTQVFAAGIYVATVAGIVVLIRDQFFPSKKVNPSSSRKK